jgi:hypothetical protein
MDEGGVDAGASKADAISSDLLSLGASVLDMIDDGEFDPSEELGKYWEDGPAPSYQSATTMQIPELEQDFVERIIVLERKVREMISDKSLSDAQLKGAQIELTEANQALKQLKLEHEGLKQQLKVQEDVARHFATQAASAEAQAKAGLSQDQSKEVSEMQAMVLKMQQDHKELLQKNTVLEQQLQKQTEEISALKSGPQANAKAEAAKEKEFKREQENWEEDRKRLQSRLKASETRNAQMTKQLNRAKIELGKWVQQQQLERAEAAQFGGDRKSGSGAKPSGRGVGTGGRRTPDQGGGGRRTPDNSKGGVGEPALVLSTRAQPETQRQKKEGAQKKDGARQRSKSGAGGGGQKKKKEPEPEEDDFWGAEEEQPKKTVNRKQAAAQASKEGSGGGKANRVVEQSKSLGSKLRQKSEAGPGQGSGGNEGGNSRSRRNTQREKLASLGTDEINKKKSGGNKVNKANREGSGTKFTVDLSKR